MFVPLVCLVVCLHVLHLSKYDCMPVGILRIHASVSSISGTTLGVRNVQVAALDVKRREHERNTVRNVEGFRAYSPPQVDRIWLRVCYDKIPTYPSFDLLGFQSLR